RIDGSFDFDNGRFLFGVNASETKMRSRGVDGHGHMMTLGDWGSTDRGQIADIASLLRQTSITGMFDDYNPGLAQSNVWTGDASELALWAEAACANGTAPAAWVAANRCDEISSKVRTTWDNDNQIEE